MSQEQGWAGEERPPEEARLLSLFGSPGSRWISRKRSDWQGKNHSLSELSCCLAPSLLHEICMKTLAKLKNM